MTDSTDDVDFYDGDEGTNSGTLTVTIGDRVYQIDAPYHPAIVTNNEIVSYIAGAYALLVAIEADEDAEELITELVRETFFRTRIQK